MSRIVDIWWTEGGRLKASMRWTNKRGRITFFLVPAPFAKCDRCPFKGSLICDRWWTDEQKSTLKRRGNLCSKLWIMKGDNQFKNRDKISGWQPLGPVERERKKNRKV